MHPLERFRYCPVCGSKHFEVQDERSKKCANCGFEYYYNVSASTAAFIFNEKGELLVLTRKKEPGKGMLDLPGGFIELGENAEQGIAREVEEETGLVVTKAEYLFSYPNVYLYSGFEVKTLDLFFRCTVKSTNVTQVYDDAAGFQWIALKDIHTEQFGMRSMRMALGDYLRSLNLRS